MQRYRVCALGFFGLSLLSCLSEPLRDQDSFLKSMEKVGNPLSKGINTLITQNGEPILRLKASEQIVYPEEILFPKGLQVIFYAKNGQVQSRLKGKRGSFDKKKTLYTVSCGVRLENINTKEYLLSQELIWNPHQKKVYTDSALSIHTQDEVHVGEGLMASEDFESYHILRPKGTVILAE
ncbi:MAG: LPS export ABC transporter periplasmic protein LptC [Cytophagales bacterium]|nr:LPS export ABC transporter periplasmic protein LptC [Cytophagales bacterium]